MDTFAEIMGFVNLGVAVLNLWLYKQNHRRQPKWLSAMALLSAFVSLVVFFRATTIGRLITAQ